MGRCAPKIQARPTVPQRLGRVAFGVLVAGWQRQASPAEPGVLAAGRVEAGPSPACWWPTEKTGRARLGPACWWPTEDRPGLAR
ncbi:hypothetical protein [Lentzea sp.]|uniref:hypothetical protein n=1 Tax=Lentzea sp. TaxID=56099 RepID=UPI002C0FA86A|nr:hypothetical protein [Lentzea sp.]HUQ57218.1 hypothetical protein [Lentzea sp.]